MYEIQLSRKAAKFYQKVGTVNARRLNAAFDRLAEDPYNHNTIKPLSGELQGSFHRKSLFDHAGNSSSGTIKVKLNVPHSGTGVLMTTRTKPNLPGLPVHLVTEL